MTIELSPATLAMAQRLALANGTSVANVVERAVEESARAAGVASEPPPRRRMTLEEVRAMAARIAALPLLDPRSPQEIIDEINET
jgi:antitoxin VapB